jgi:transcriptional regulator with XRE-family HTH domain
MTAIIKKMKKSLEAIRRLIKQDLANLSQTAIAEKVGISQAAIFKYLETDTQPTLKTLEKFSSAYGIPLQDLLGHEAPGRAGGVPAPKRLERVLGERIGRKEISSETMLYVDKLLRILEGDDERAKGMVKSLLDALTVVESKKHA